MKPIERISSAHPTLAHLAALAAITVLAGCVYQPDIQQGNLLQISDVEQVKPGMTRSQVRYVLGTPMISDPFEPQRWDYIYTFRKGRSRHVDRSYFVVYFDGDNVTRVEKLDLPEETETQRIIREQREARGESQPAPPAGATGPAPQSGQSTTPEAPPDTSQPPGGH
jgi:outer membrane protein assembly factor BamE